MKKYITPEFDVRLFEKEEVATTASSVMKNWKDENPTGRSTVKTSFEEMRIIQSGF